MPESLRVGFDVRGACDARGAERREIDCLIVNAADDSGGINDKLHNGLL